MIEGRISVLIPSGSGAPGFAGIAACLREDPRIRLVSGDMRADAYGKSLSDAFYLMPPSNDSLYINRILEICTKEKIHVILPITTAELIVLSEKSDVFVKQGIQVLVSSIEGLKQSNDKGRLHTWAKTNGIAVPEGNVCLNKGEFEETANRLLLRHPRLFFKPVTGNGSRGIGLICGEIEPVISSNKPELMALLLAEWLQRLPENFEVPILLTEYLPGKEYSVDAFIWDGYDTIAIPRSRDKMVSGISVSGKFERNELLISETKKVVEALVLRGPIGVQWRYNADGLPHLLEINPRLQGTTSTLRHVGLNIPLMAVKRSLGIDVELPEALNWNRSFTRHWQDVFL